jgi:exonuclease III
MIEKPLTIATLNVRGLRNSSHKPKQIKAWLASLFPPPQVILIQEHHLGKEGIKNTANGIEFWQGTSFWNKGIPTGTSQRLSAGTAILIDKSTVPLVKDHGILSEGRAQYITLQSPNGGTLTVINIYAPNSSNDRAPFWRKLSQAELVSDHFIVGGDFNHSEIKDRREASGERRMLRREAATWHQMTLHYGLIDAWSLDNFRKMSSKEFTFDNGRAGPRSAVSRLDKFMISQEIKERGGRIETAIFVRKLSDHSPLMITVWGNHPPPLGNPPRFFDISLLGEEEHKKETLEAWNGDQGRPPNDQGWPEWLEAAIRRVTS